MKILYKIIILLLISCSTIGQDNNKLYFKKNTSKAAVNKALKEGYKIYLKVSTTNSDSVIAVVEPLLFKIYGKKQIISERPYQVSSNRFLWNIEGYIPKGARGGTFNITINKETGEVVKVGHYQ